MEQGKLKVPVIRKLNVQDGTYLGKKIRILLNLNFICNFLGFNTHE